MMLQALYPRETEAQLERARLQPWDPAEDLQPGAFKNLDRAIGLGLVRGGAVTARAGALGVAGLAGYLPDGLSDRAQDMAVQGLVDPLGEQIAALTPGPREVGTAGRIAGGLAEIVAPLLAGGGNPSLLIGTQQMSVVNDLVGQGVDIETASGVGLVNALATGVGFRLPILGKTLAGKIGFGAGSNLVLGAGADALSQEELRFKGYARVAEQFDPTDFERRAVDMLSGVVFGGIVHATTPKGAQTPGVREALFGPAGASDPVRRFVDAVIPDTGASDGAAVARADLADRIERVRGQFAVASPSERQAILTLANMQHAELDTAPGKIVSLRALHLHTMALESATQQVLRGEPVTASVDAAQYPADPRRVAWQDGLGREVEAEQAALGAAYDRVLSDPLGPPDDPLVVLRPEEIGEVLVERGPNFPADGEVEVRPGGHGLVKIIWRHGEKSGKRARVTREDVLALPHILRAFETVPDDPRPTWVVERADGQQVVYGTRRFNEDARQRVVTLHVNEEAPRTLSAKKQNRQTGSRSGGFQPTTADTGRPAFVSPDGSQSDGFLTSIAPTGAGFDPSDLRLFAAVDEALVAVPDLAIPTGALDETGRPLTLSAREAFAQADAEIARAEADAAAYRVAANCFLRTS